MSDDIYLETDGDIATVVLNRPAKRNALTFDMWQRLPDLLAQVEERAELRILVLRGAGDRAFSAGADVSEFESLRATAEDGRTYNAAAGRAQDALASMTGPTIALIRGACVGGGLGLALSCDIRFCDTSAKFAITPAKLGIVYPIDVTKRLVDLVGPAHAKSILFTGMPVDAERARQLGLVNDVIDGGVIEADTIAYARTISSRAPYSIRATKRFIDLISSGLTHENDETLAVRGGAFDTEDHREGVRAFLEKRSAVFRDA